MMCLTAAERSWRYDVAFPCYAHLPSTWAYRCAAVQARYFMQKHQAQREAIRSQMQQVFSEADEHTINTWLYDYFRMVEQEALDTWLLPRAPQIVRLSGFEAVMQARAAGKRVILTGGHFGRFWMAGPAMRQAGYSVGTITRDGDTGNKHGLHPAEYRYRLFKLKKLQAHLGGPFLTEGADLRPFYRELDQHLITLIFDVPYPERPAGCVTVPFLGGKMKVPAGVYRIAKKTKAFIAPFYMRDLGGGQVIAEFSALLDPNNYNDEGLMSHLASQLEAQIRLRPGHWWLWEALPLLRR